MYRGQDLIHTHVEDVIAVLSKESGFVCDCVDHDLADTYNFPVLGLELWREEPYHPKLLKEPGFQRMITRDPLQIISAVGISFRFGCSRISSGLISL